MSIKTEQVALQLMRIHDLLSSTAENEADQPSSNDDEYLLTLQEDAKDYGKLAKLVSKGKGRKALLKYQSLDTASREWPWEFLIGDELNVVIRYFGE